MLDAEERIFTGCLCRYIVPLLFTFHIQINAIR